jgi:hypothetical protein
MAADWRSMDEARKWNAELDVALRARGVVDQLVHMRLLEAYRYDVVSSIGWVEAKMRVLLDRVRQGKELSLFVPALREQKLVRSELELWSWIDENFPGLSV